jgi:hypothetical protein
MAYPARLSLWDKVIDESRCREVDGVGGRCQLLREHQGQHMLQRHGQRDAWPVGAVPQGRPPWSPGGYPRDET